MIRRQEARVAVDALPYAVEENRFLAARGMTAEDFGMNPDDKKTQSAETRKRETEGRTRNNSVLGAPVRGCEIGGVDGPPGKA